MRASRQAGPPSPSSGLFPFSQSTGAFGSPSRSTARNFCHATPPLHAPAPARPRSVPVPVRVCCGVQLMRWKQVEFPTGGYLFKKMNVGPSNFTPFIRLNKARSVPPPRRAGGARVAARRVCSELVGRLGARAWHAARRLLLPLPPRLQRARGRERVDGEWLPGMATAVASKQPGQRLRADARHRRGRLGLVWNGLLRRAAPCGWPPRCRGWSDASPSPFSSCPLSLSDHCPGRCPGARPSRSPLSQYSILSL
jgi:hypothetical protein